MARWLSNRGLAFALCLATIASILCAALELSVQQALRQSANDPQIQIAEDASISRAVALQAVRTRTAPAPTEIAHTLAPWIALYDRAGRPLAASALLDGSFPRVPSGVLAFVAAHGEHRLTWQPRAGVRDAIVVTRTPTGEFVIAGRSLREVEKREAALLEIVAAAWLLAVTGSGIVAVTLMPPDAPAFTARA